MNRPITSTAIPARALKIKALANMTASFESFCLASGMEALAEMMESDAEAACGPRHARDKGAEGVSLGQSERQGRLPRRQVGDRTPSSSRLRRQGAGARQLGSRARRRLAPQKGGEPDADQRLDAQV